MNQATAQATQNRPSQLPGPNRPCWCGSGEKYKKCHRERDAAELSAGAAEERARRGQAQAALRPVRPAQVSPRRQVPPQIARPDYADLGIPGPGVDRDPDPVRRLARLRRACKAAAEVLVETSRSVRAGVTTDELDAICHAAYLARGGYPSTLNYRGYPKSLCTSVNEVICHGIPDARALEDGDMVNLDVTIYLDGMHGDCSATFAVGKLDPEGEKLVRVARECLDIGIAAVKPGGPIRAIGRAIEEHAQRSGCTIFRAYCGHGIGERFHCPPEIPHYDERRATTVMEEGMIFTIEPMVNLGTGAHVDWDDGWTVATADGRRSAQFEHTIVVTRDGAEVLTIA
jgi:methionyl aminopeptidase